MVRYRFWILTTCTSAQMLGVVALEGWPHPRHDPRGHL
ncbi:hypothetical protein PA07A_2332 [Cutibacterium acnes P07A]|nr:hypothetical protein [Cutibacterium acnes P07A]